MKAIKRLLQYVDYKGFNKRTFEIDNGLSNGYLGKQLLRNADLGEGILNKIIENCPDLSPEWLLTGKGEMITDDNIKKPPANADGLKERYIFLLERTVADLEKKIAEIKENKT